jgi:GGDEF domain-containing protein
LIAAGEIPRSQDGSADAPLIGALSLLLQGMELHTLDYNQEDYQCFRADLAAIQQKLLPETPVAELLVLVDEAIRTFAEYNQRTAGRLHAKFQELRAATAAFSGAAATMVSAGDASLVQLREMESQLSAAAQIDDLPTLKTPGSDALERQKNSAPGITRVAEGARELGTLANRIRGRTVADPVTGLPTRAEAEAVLNRVAGNGIPAVAVIFAVKRLKQMNSRFGYEVGNGVLAELSTYLGSGANPEEGLYRWSGPALLAIIRRNAHLDRIRWEIGRLASSMSEHEITIGARLVMIPVSIGWMAFPVTRPIDRLVRQLETFVEGQNAEDSYAAR